MRFMVWLNKLGLSAEHRKLLDREGEFILGNSISGDEAEAVVFGLVRDQCPTCHTAIVTTEQMHHSVRYLWSCPNPICGEQFFIKRVGRYKLIDHAPRRETHDTRSRP